MWWLYRSLRLAGCMVVVQKLEASRLRGGWYRSSVIRVLAAKPG